MGGCEGEDIGRPELKSEGQAQFSMRQDGRDQPHLGYEFTEKTRSACEELKHCKKKKKRSQT